MFSDPWHILLYTVAALLPVANPMGLSAPFYTMTSHMEVVARRRVAWRVALYFFALVTGTLVLGVLVLEIFDISIGVVDIAGGLVLFHAAWKMLEGDGSAHGEHEGKEDPAFFPLTMPLTADAAVLAIAISISGSLKHHWDYHTVIEYGAAVGGIGIVALVVGICYSTSHHTVGRLGRTGIKVVTAITAFLLLAVAVEIIVTGIKDVAAHFHDEPEGIELFQSAPDEDAGHAEEEAESDEAGETGAGGDESGADRGAGAVGALRWRALWDKSHDAEEHRMELNHTIIPVRDKEASARFFAEIMGLSYDGPAGHFAPVRVNDALTMDFDNATDFQTHHYAFKVSDAEFDGIFARIEAAGVAYGSGPFSWEDGSINTRHGGRGFYWRDIDGHLMEVLTRDA